MAIQKGAPRLLGVGHYWSHVVPMLCKERKSSSAFCWWMYIIVLCQTLIDSDVHIFCMFSMWPPANRLSMWCMRKCGTAGSKVSPHSLGLGFVASRGRKKPISCYKLHFTKQLYTSCDSPWALSIFKDRLGLDLVFFFNDPDFSPFGCYGRTSQIEDVDLVKLHGDMTPTDKSCVYIFIYLYSEDVYYNF